MTEDEIKDIIHRTINDTHECKDDDKISISYIEINETKYAIYQRYNRSQWPLLFLLNLSTTEVIEIDQGLKGGALEIKSEDEYILMRGRLWGQGTIDDWYKYSIEPPYFIGPV
jgi:hypothetical protein